MSNASSNSTNRRSRFAFLRAKPDQSANRVPWHPLLAIGLVVAIYFISQLVGGLLVSLYPALHHWSTQHANDWLNNSVSAQFVYIVVAEGLTLSALWFFVRRYKFDIRRFGLVRPQKVDVVYTLAGFGFYFIAYAALLAAVSALIPSLNLNQQQQIGFQDAHSVAQLTMAAISLVVLPPLAEEILMRGFLYTSLRGYMSKLVAALITSVIFASGHLQWGDGAPLLWVAAIDTFVLSMVLVSLREKTGRLWAGVGLHALKNGVAFMVLFIFHAH